MKALISVSDKTGLTEIAGQLASSGWDILCTAGTYKALAEVSIKAHSVESLTDFAEILGGRVKTLHPRIHAAILSTDSEEHQNELQELGVDKIDLVVVNLYPFRATAMNEKHTLEEAIDAIDIGGVALLRAAAKNYKHTTVVFDPRDYELVISAPEHVPNLETRKELAVKAFAHTSSYDYTISHYLQHHTDEQTVHVSDTLPENNIINITKVTDLRYGENPHQKAALYKNPLDKGGLVDAKILQGKQMSYLNYLDADAAYKSVKMFEIPACVIVKHASPCCIATADNLAEAFIKSHECDKVSAYGGVVGLNREVDEATANEISQRFFDVIIAPSYSEAALSILSSKPKLRLIEISPTSYGKLLIANIDGGYLLQTENKDIGDRNKWKVATKLSPDAAMWKNMELAWKSVIPLKSNAISIVKDNQLLACCGGQPNRVLSAQIALAHAGSEATGATLASDAFLPFTDTVELSIEKGIKGIVQPGGSVRDAEIIDLANSAGIVMVFTGIRAFYH